MALSVVTVVREHLAHNRGSLTQQQWHRPEAPSYRAEAHLLNLQTSGCTAKALGHLGRRRNRLFVLNPIV